MQRKIFHVVFTVILLGWLKKNDLFENYGLALPEYMLGSAWFYIPLMLIGIAAGIVVVFVFALVAEYLSQLSESKTINKALAEYQQEKG